MLDQREEGGLKGVVGIAALAQYPPTHSQDHWPVTTNHHFESSGVAIGFELPKEFAIRAVYQALAQRDAADMVNEFVKHNCHAGPPFRRRSTQIECADGAKRPGKKMSIGNEPEVDAEMGDREMRGGRATKDAIN